MSSAGASKPHPGRRDGRIGVSCSAGSLWHLSSLVGTARPAGEGDVEGDVERGHQRHQGTQGGRLSRGVANAPTHRWSFFKYLAPGESADEKMMRPHLRELEPARQVA
jgi:hypothetical protein